MLDVATACVIIIGNEILSGGTQDANLAYIGRGLAARGIALDEARVVPDVDAAIVEAVNHCRKVYTYVITTGGIGPTHDDITTRSIARAFDVAVECHPDAVARLRRYYGEEPLNPARLKMAEVPTGAELIANPISGAPGYRIENVYVLAGVPRIMQAMFDCICDRLPGGPPILSRAISTNLQESALAEMLEALQRRYAETSIGSYPFYRQGKFGVSVVLRGRDNAVLDQLAAELRAQIAGLGGACSDEYA